MIWRATTLSVWLVALALGISSCSRPPEPVAAAPDQDWQAYG